jgi:molybdenum-dependent DNA-binding transcriptional regulator ModE
VLADMPARAHRVTARAKIWLEAHGHFAVGNGGGRFFAAVHETGSIRVGAEQVGHCSGSS